jgi:hypothetical protein
VKAKKKALADLVKKDIVNKIDAAFTDLEKLKKDAKGVAVPVLKVDKAWQKVKSAKSAEALKELYSATESLRDYDLAMPNGKTLKVPVISKINFKDLNSNVVWSGRAVSVETPDSYLKDKRYAAYLDELSGYAKILVALIK